MICERGGCCGSGGNQPHPAYALLLLAIVVAVLVALHELHNVLA